MLSKPNKGTVTHDENTDRRPDNVNARLEVSGPLEMAQPLAPS